MTTPMRRAQNSVSRGQATLARVNDVAAQQTWVMGRIAVEGIGETTVDVKFPVTFGEKPFPILGGGEYLGKTPTWNEFPTAQAVVIAWETGTSTNDRYTGATLAITTTGRQDQIVYVSFAFVGVALTNAPTD
jgi:hypothetical protein